MDDEGDAPLELIGVSKQEFDKVMEFALWVKSNPYPHPLPRPLPKQGRLKAVISDEWYHKFLEMGKDGILSMVWISQYLGFEKLFELSCAKVGDYLKDMNIDHMRSFFGIENDFTPEEEAEAKRGNINLFES